MGEELQCLRGAAPILLKVYCWQLLSCANNYSSGDNPWKCVLFCHRAFSTIIQIPMVKKKNPLGSLSRGKGEGSPLEKVWQEHRSRSGLLLRSQAEQKRNINTRFRWLNPAEPTERKWFLYFTLTASFFSPCWVQASSFKKVAPGEICGTLPLLSYRL